MTQITFVSHYNKTELNINITSESARLMFSSTKDEPIRIYLDDCDRVHEGTAPKYFSEYQIKKLQSYLPGIDVWSSISITKVLNDTAKEIIDNIDSNGGWHPARRLSEREIAKYIFGSYICSRNVAKKVASELSKR